MALTEELVIDYLLQLTTDAGRSLQWQEIQTGGFRTELNGVEIDLQPIPSRSGNCLYLFLRSDTLSTFIQEHRQPALFGARAEGDDLTSNMRALHRAVAYQCETRREVEERHRDEIRESVFRQLLFGPSL